MTTANYSVNFSAVLDATSGTIAAGQVAVLNTNGSAFVVALTANRGTRRSSGIFLSAATGGQAVAIQSSGTVDAATTGLAAQAGAAQYARVNFTTGRLERVAVPGPADEIVGTIDEFGNAVVQFAASWVSGTLPVASGGTGLATLGTALQVLRTNAGATATEWATSAGVTTPTLLGDGTVGAPAYSFTSNATLGLYRIGADQMGVAGGANGLVGMYGNATLTNLDPLNPAVVRYSSRLYSQPIAGVNETCALYVRTSYANAGEAGTCGLYMDVPNTQVNTYGSAIKINHAGHGDGIYISCLSTDGAGIESARWSYGGGANYISTFQTSKATGTIDNPAFQALFCSTAGVGAPAIPGNVLPGYGLFYANNASGKAFVARKFGDGNVADGVPMYVLYENNLADLRWAVYNNGSTTVSAQPAVNSAGNITRNSPIIRCQGARWNGGTEFQGGYFQYAYDTQDIITSSGFRFYTGVLGAESLAFIVRSTGLDFNAAANITNCTSIGNYSAPFDITTNGATIAEFTATIADGATGLLLRRNVGGVYTLQAVTMGAADSGGAGFKVLRVAN